MEKTVKLIDIMIKLQKKYGKFTEILNLTNELNEALRRNDRHSADIILRMRAEEFENVDQINRDLSYLLYCLDSNDKIYIYSNETITDDMPKEIIKIREIVDKNNRLLEKIIDIDKYMNLRLAGNNSYYNKK